MASNEFKGNVAILGAGPVGLAAAAHLAKHRIPFSVYEMSDDIAGSIMQWRHVKLFSPWRYNIDSAARDLLEQTKWSAPDESEYPTGEDLIVRYLKPLSLLAQLDPYIKLGHRVVSISRRSIDKIKDKDRADAPFEISLITSTGIETVEKATAIIDASGTWQQPNPMSANGLPAIGEQELSATIQYGIPDLMGEEKEKYLGRRIAVVGSGHSAANSLLMLVQLAKEDPGTIVNWVLRGNDMNRVFGGGEKDALPARGQLGAELKNLVKENRLLVHKNFRVHTVLKQNDEIVIAGRDSNLAPIKLVVDRVIVATGQRPNLDMTRELRLDLDPGLECARTLAPMIDPNYHSCGTVPPHGVRELMQPEPNYYIVGNKSYGRATSFLLATGYEQVRSVAAYLAGDLESAYAVKLALPKTGVCSTDNSNSQTSGQCCTPSINTTDSTEPSCGSGCTEKEKKKTIAQSCC